MPSETVTREECTRHIAELHLAIDKIHERIEARSDKLIERMDNLFARLEDRLPKQIASGRQRVEIRVTLASGAAGGAIVGFIAFIAPRLPEWMAALAK